MMIKKEIIHSLCDCPMFDDFFYGGKTFLLVKVTVIISFNDFTLKYFILNLKFPFPE